ncbi:MULTISPECIES: polysaccharide lyase family 7 protein [unclassified Vibrio]|uniref:polysaccharide lyase family 7 protein n=1 Tax=unclassified Vibrio TaxID=2614977 RepID=UPI00187F2805|nr:MULTISPECIES: polysaccharide lyase family 7 protein [unclassified Vibrio]EGX6961688.1 polysaccharide lyase family 7 protein [Vibrio alginolyticus]EJX2554554.1 polysaccharide lyase family 7 protein [Vibrio alginolyticus]ELA6659968.1 polysaccharide lyase family 7 protein [Vibrio alginolyticus]MBE8570041.1 polysaccharide lyase family 7 protein [Vibrio sp. OPT46]MBE8581970.1 polysaccharide lyase family 7 protein [Vibrio sp. OPT41]
MFIKSTKLLLISFSGLGLIGCGGNTSPTSQDDKPNIPHQEHVAPYSIAKFQNILSNSDLQVSDPNGKEGNKTSDVKNGAFSDYKSDHFYAEKDSNYLVFKMSNYKMRSEVRERENFNISEQGVSRTLYADVRLPEINLAMASSPANHDEVTFLQIHNKGTDTSGTGAIPHPLLRIVWEQERNSITGHYWAVVKNNAIDCSLPSSASDCYATSYDRYDLGKADLNAFTRFEVKIGENTLTIKVNDEQKVNVDVSYWQHLLSYFKAGVYNQFENGEAKVQFKQLGLTETDHTDSIAWNIDDWKLTIPTSKNDWYGFGGDSATELEPERCNSSKDPLSNEESVYQREIDLSYFNVIDGSMHFRADMGYGTSTANSSYIRSELRELYISTNSPDCSTSDEETSWYIEDSRTGATSHTLNATLRINEYPKIDGQLPKVVVGQIHGWKISQALVKLLWEGDNKPVRVILNDNYKLDNNKDCTDCNAFSVKLGTYAVNEDWQYTIRADKEGLFLATYDADGSNMVSHTLKWGEAYSDTANNKSYTLTERWASPDIAFYFKAGIYPQFKPDNAYRGEIFDVSFSALSTLHQ